MGKEEISKNVLTVTYEALPTEENIEYAFQRLAISLISATGFRLYQESHQEFKEVLSIVSNWVVLYSNTKDLTQINWNEFIEIRQKLFELDEKYMLEKEWYSQQAYEWVLQLGVLLEKSNDKRRMGNEI